MLVWKIIDKIKIEIKCYFVDLKETMKLERNTCFRMYKPSFYIRYTPEQQKAILEEDKKRIVELLREME